MALTVLTDIPRFPIALYGIGAETGEELWQAEVSFDASSGYQALSAIGDHGLVVTTGDTGHLLGYDGSTGELTWDLPLSGDDVKLNVGS